MLVIICYLSECYGLVGEVYSIDVVSGIFCSRCFSGCDFVEWCYKYKLLYKEEMYVVWVEWGCWMKDVSERCKLWKMRWNIYFVSFGLIIVK